MTWKGKMPPRETVQMIIADIPNDVENMERQPFTGANVAHNFGSVWAQVLVLGKLVDHALERLEELDRRTRPDDFMS